MSVEFEFSQCTLAWQVFRGLSAHRESSKTSLMPVKTSLSQSRHRAAGTALGWGTHHRMHLGHSAVAHTAQHWEPEERGTAQILPLPTPHHEATRDWHLENPMKTHFFKNEKKTFLHFISGRICSSCEECSRLLYTHECLARPHKDRYYSKGWVAELITAGIATEHRQAELIGSSRSVWCQACTSCHCIVCCMVKVFLSIHQYDFDEWSFGYTEVANIYEYPWACNDRSKHIIYPSLEHSALLFLLDIDKKTM